jgi:hypothetical protein
MHSKKTSIISGLVGTSAFLMIVLLYVFLKELRLGIRGVIYAMLIVALFKNVLGYLLSQRYFRIRYEITRVFLGLFGIVLGAVLISKIGFLASPLFMVVLLKLAAFGLCAVLILRIINMNFLKILFSAKSEILKI